MYFLSSMINVTNLQYHSSLRLWISSGKKVYDGDSMCKNSIFFLPRRRGSKATEQKHFKISSCAHSCDWNLRQCMVTHNYWNEQINFDRKGIKLIIYIGLKIKYLNNPFILVNATTRDQFALLCLIETRGSKIVLLSELVPTLFNALHNKLNRHRK